MHIYESVVVLIDTSLDGVYVGMKHKGPATVPLGSIASVNKDRWEVDCGREADNNGVFDPRYHYEVGSGGASVHAKRSKKGTKGAAGKVVGGTEEEDRWIYSVHRARSGSPSRQKQLAVHTLLPYYCSCR